MIILPWHTKLLSKPAFWICVWPPFLHPSSSHSYHFSLSSVHPSFENMDCFFSPHIQREPNSEYVFGPLRLAVVVWFSGVGMDRRDWRLLPSCQEVPGGFVTSSYCNKTTGTQLRQAGKKVTKAKCYIFKEPTGRFSLWPMGDGLFPWSNLLVQLSSSDFLKASMGPAPGVNQCWTNIKILRYQPSTNIIFFMKFQPGWIPSITRIIFL